jgi:hypothetical protein
VLFVLKVFSRFSILLLIRKGLLVAWGVHTSFDSCTQRE